MAEGRQTKALDVWLATFAALPDGGSEGRLVSAAFAARGVDARWAVWDDPHVDWAAAPLVAVRSTWDYHLRHAEFLAWAERVDAVTRLVNPLSVLRWNSEKSYLAELPGIGVPAVPTRVVDSPATVDQPTVLKPVVGASGLGVRVVAAGTVVHPDGTRPWVLQPLVASVWSEGEYSVYVLGGSAVAAAVKRPGGGDIRVHEEYGGATRRAELTQELADVAESAVAAVAARFGVPLAYARADLMRLDDGTLVVSELELVEPGLYADVLPEVPDAYAGAIADVLR